MAINLATTMDDLAEAFGTISGLAFFGWPNWGADPGKGGVGVVGYPDEIDYDQTFQTAGRSSADKATFPVFLVVGSQLDKEARNRLSAFVSSSEAKSIKAAVEANVDFTCTVTDCQIVTIEMAGREMLAAKFMAEVVN